jgi:hypothetical protein
MLAETGDAKTIRGSAMTRDEILEQLTHERAQFDALVDAIAADAMDRPVPEHIHTPKQIVAHVSAYEQLVVERLRAARLGQTTDLERDRLGYEAFNDHMWSQCESQETEVVLASSARTFLMLVEELAGLPDEEFGALSKVAEAIDPGWLRGRNLWEALAEDTFEHYPMHCAQLEAVLAETAASS